MTILEQKTFEGGAVKVIIVNGKMGLVKRIEEGYLAGKCTKSLKFTYISAIYRTEKEAIAACIDKLNKPN